MLRGGLLLGLLLASPAFAVGLLEKNHPAIEAGIDAYDDGRFEDALAAFQAVKQELPGDPRVDFNIGNALYKLGRYEEAKDAWLRAAENDKGKGALQQKDYYNLGNAFAQLNKKKDAIAAYRKALTLDPSDPLARHNLEVLLRNIPPQDSKDEKGDGGQDGGQDAGHP
ncbi:MAG: tetratricopeptide repeat protein, partial [Myxococcaceae bacterium]